MPTMIATIAATYSTLRTCLLMAVSCGSVGPFRAQHQSVAIVIDGYLELDRSATHRAVLDEALPASAGGIDADVVRFGAAGTHVGRVALERHRDGLSGP
jgi:hypothetical protein